MYERVVVVDDLTVVDNDNTYTSYARAAAIGRFKIYCYKISHVTLYCISHSMLHIRIRVHLVAIVVFVPLRRHLVI